MKAWLCRQAQINAISTWKPPFAGGIAFFAMPSQRVRKSYAGSLRRMKYLSQNHLKGLGIWSESRENTVAMGMVPSLWFPFWLRLTVMKMRQKPSYWTRVISKLFRPCRKLIQATLLLLRIGSWHRYANRFGATKARCRLGSLALNSITPYYVNKAEIRSHWIVCAQLYHCLNIVNMKVAFRHCSNFFQQKCRDSWKLRKKLLNKNGQLMKEWPFIQPKRFIQMRENKFKWHKTKSYY